MYKTNENKNTFNIYFELQTIYATFVDDFMRIK